jgi:nucleotide-binding universal stress UspA family protein
MEENMRFTRILVPTDFSPGGENAAVAACAFARAVGGTIRLFHVYNPPSLMLPDGSTFAPTPAELVQATERADHALAALERTLAARVGGAVAIEVASAIGDAADEILRLAESGDYDVIVMGTHGRTGIRRMMLGSVAEKVLRRAPIPVLTIREHDAADRSPQHSANE